MRVEVRGYTSFLRLIFFILIMKIPIERCNRLLDSNLSLIPIGDAKKPSILWTKHQTEIISKEEFSKHYEAAKGIGIITGYNNIEVIDVDLKVLSSLKRTTRFLE